MKNGASVKVYCKSNSQQMCYREVCVRILSPVKQQIAFMIALVGFLFTTGSGASDISKVEFGPQLPPYTKPQFLAITGGLLIDATGAAPKTGQTVLIKNGLIYKIGSSEEIEIPTGTPVFDANGMTVMPGLISSNQHIQLNPLHPAPVADIPYDELIERWEENFRDMPKKAFVTLMQGVTTMRQTSGPWKRILPVKKQIDRGEIPGPRILLGGALIESPQAFEAYLKEQKTPPEAVDWLRNEFAFFVVDDIEKDLEVISGEDFTYWKILFGHESFDGSNDFTDDQVRRIIEKAHAAGKQVDIHANSTPEGYARLLKFDFETLQHPFVTDFLQDEEVISEFAKKGIIVATLLRVRIAGAEHANDPNRFTESDYIMSMDPDEYFLLMRYRDKLLSNLRNPEQKGLSIYDKGDSGSNDFGMQGPSFVEQQKGMETARENMRRFINAGVKLSMGTDAPTFLNFLQDDPNAKELAYMVELGMTPMDAIMAGTRNGAEAIGMLDKLGTLEEGKIADIIVVAGNPLESMEAMKRVAVVIKDGIRYK
ncbi:MAG: amidohydrolase family protein [Xanthomonadales bacterium]|nr:amidohydrolase family protein [Xanthomonadales bacterium]